MEGQPGKRRSVRQAVTRKRSLYLDPETDDDFTMSDDNNESRAEEEQVESAPKRVKNGPNSTKQKRPQTRSRNSARSATVKKLPPKASGHELKDPSRLTKAAARVAPPIPSDLIVPKWQSLPYEILAQIFAYAYAAELEIEDGIVANRRVHHPNTWIMRTARKVCRAFAEPALSAFYQSPNLLASRWLEDLSALLKQPSEQRAFRYHNKIRKLRISARDLDSHTRDGTFSLPELVTMLPQLSELIITHPQDDIPFEPMSTRSVRWKYPAELFDALDANKTSLIAWRWNRLLEPEPGQAFNLVKQIHVTAPFQNLRHLSISELAEINNPSGDEGDPEGVDIAKAISLLPKLESLAFDTCDCLSDQLLSHLPDNLQRFRAVNCMTLTSDILYNFLSRNGCDSPTLKELVLNHNPFLDLAFLTTLRTTCPNLITLQMDLYDHRENHFRHFGEPKYEALLVEDEIPTWPSTLQTLELVHLQKWGAEAAQNLFRSLVESADSLLDLRKLVLHAHINISWRDRAAFRDQWIERLRRVYQRYSNDPDPHLASLKAFRLWMASEKARVASPEPRGRALSHVEISPPKGPPATTLQDQVSDGDTLSKRRSKRISDQVSIQTLMPVEDVQPVKNKGSGRRKRGRSDSDAISINLNKNEETDEDDWRHAPEKFVQGLCDIVDISIDNQRPRQDQLNESHFIDSEASGDEEWTEGAEVQDDAHAW